MSSAWTNHLRFSVRAEVEGIETVVAGEGAVEVSGRGGAGKPGGAGRGDRADAHGGAGLGGNAAGADGAGLLGEPAVFVGEGCGDGEVSETFGGPKGLERAANNACSDGSSMTRAGLHRETTYRRLLPDRSRDQRRARPRRLPLQRVLPKTDDKDVNGRARKARREIIARITYPAASC